MADSADLQDQLSGVRSGEEKIEAVAELVDTAVDDVLASSQFATLDPLSDLLLCFCVAVEVVEDHEAGHRGAVDEK